MPCYLRRRYAVLPLIFDDFRRATPERLPLLIRHFRQL